MPYKISGDLSEPVRIIIIKESDWSIESNTTVSGLGYEKFLTNTAKTIIARRSTGESLGYGNITPELVIGDRGVFGGGYAAGFLNVIEYITISTTSNSNDFGDLTEEKYYLAATSNGINDRGVYGGGFNSVAASNVIEYIAISVLSNALDFGDLDGPKVFPGATSNDANNRGIWAGGGTGTAYVPMEGTIDYVTISTAGNANNFGNLSLTRTTLCGTSNGTNNRGIFAGGETANNSYVNTIDYVTISTTGDALDFGDLSINKAFLTAVSNNTNDIGIFAGGIDSSVVYNTIEYITITSTGNANNFGDLTVARYSLSGSSNGVNNRGIFGGGRSGSNNLNVIDYITISTPGDAADFGDLTVEKRHGTATSNA